MPLSFSATDHPVRQMLAAELDEALLPTGIERAACGGDGWRNSPADEVGERRLQEKGREMAGDADRAVERGSDSSAGTTMKPSAATGTASCRRCRHR